LQAFGNARSQAPYHGHNIPVSSASVRFTNEMRVLLPRWDLLVPFRRLARAITFSSRSFVFVMLIVPKDDIDPHSSSELSPVGRIEYIQSRHRARVLHRASLGFRFWRGAALLDIEQVTDGVEAPVAPKHALVSIVPVFLIPLIGYGTLYLQPLDGTNDSFRALLTGVMTVAGLGLQTLRLAAQGGELQRAGPRMQLLTAATEQTADLIRWIRRADDGRGTDADPAARSRDCPPRGIRRQSDCAQPAVVRPETCAGPRSNRRERHRSGCAGAAARISPVAEQHRRGVAPPSCRVACARQS
jgi:hypothetical protein